MDEQPNAQFTPSTNPPPYTQPIPMPREFNGKKYYGAADVAKILGVTQKTVWKWQNDLYFGCQLFAADERAHDGRYLYDVERVMQLKAVYRPNWTQGGYDATNAAQIEQPLANLPEEILSSKRFFPVAKNKSPLIKGWSNPATQKPLAEIDSEYVGFDTCGHDISVDYLFLDFDHVLNDQGEFVNDEAEDWFNSIQLRLGGYAERSISGTGIHIFAKPSPGKFDTIGAGKNGVLYFDRDANIKVEIFYKSAGRYCLVTGELYETDSRDIASGAVVDEVLADILAEIQKRLPAADHKPEPARQPAKLQAGDMKIIYSSETDTPDYDQYRAEIMLTCINPADLEDSDWLAVMSACKNIGIDYSVVDSWNQRDADRYHAGENLKRWDSLNNPSYDIETLHGSAKRFGYSERDTRRQWYQLYPQKAPSGTKNTSERLKRELDDAVAWIESLTPENFTANDARSFENVRAVALASAFGFPADVEKFFSTVKAAKLAAKNRIKEAADGLTEPLQDNELYELNALVEGTDITSLRRRIEREVTKITKEQDRFDREEIRRRAEEEHRRKQQNYDNMIKNVHAELLQLKALPQSAERDAKIIKALQILCDSKKDRDGKITVKSTQENADLLFTYDPNIDGLFGYDEFQQADVFLKPAPWNRRAKKGDEWTDADDAQLQTFFRRRYSEFTGENLFRNTFVSYSRARSFHEVKEYFLNLPKWDGKKRAETLFIKFLKAEDSPYTREVTLNWLTAAVARIFHPGCEYQLAPVLLGEQGIGKSYLIGKLGGKWYGTLVDDTGDPHAIDAIQKMWLVEIKEMAAMKKDVDANKRFIDSSEDTRRFAYDRRTRRVKRHCVFVITTNNRMCLTDLTGNRRFPVILCHGKPRDYVTGLTDAYIAQVWAEVFAHCKELFKDGFDPAKLELSKAAQIQSDTVAEQFTRDDIGEEIQSFLEKKIPPLVIWHLLSKEERRKFFVDGGTFKIELADLQARFKNSAGRKFDELKPTFDAACEVQDGFVRIFTEKDSKWFCAFYGAELRQHICPAEIFNECFDKTDRRKSVPKILEVLNKIDGWEQGARLRNFDPEYKDQKIVFHRA